MVIPRQMFSVESHQVFELAFLTGHGLKSLSPPKPVQQLRLVSPALKHSPEMPKMVSQSVGAGLTLARPQQTQGDRDVP